eukprot:5420150-Pyramimonas_sp.AAC.1
MSELSMTDGDVVVSEKEAEKPVVDMVTTPFVVAPQVSTPFVVAPQVSTREGLITQTDADHSTIYDDLSTSAIRNSIHEVHRTEHRTKTLKP